MFDHIINWTLQRGSHEFPGPDGGTCINEAALVAAGFPYRAINTASDMPPCFSRVIAQYALVLNDQMPDCQRQRLKPYILRLAGTADLLDVEHARVKYLAMQAVTVFAAKALDSAGLPELAHGCRTAATLGQAQAAATEAVQAVDWAPAVVLAPMNAVAASATAAASAQAKEWARAAEAATSAMNAAAEWPRAAAWPAETAGATGAWDDALSALDGVLAIGRQAEPIERPLAIARLDRAKVRT